ncbi:phosphoadenosine phosphosulfate reductase family protein [Streptomyces sp. NPDC052043]|uniref:phosphoadenosine phosphosulfate reductase domain-containing protein n=1 Tax=Streptomyces sp. NPDC052043 TaxID=3365684 RepID=UPI0037D9513C
MSSRSAKRQPLGDMFPGMPDTLDKRPPKAADDEAWKARTLDEAIERTHEVLQRVITEFSTGDATSTVTKGRHKGSVRNYGPRETAGKYVLYSGGNDSVITARVCRPYVDGMVHVNTGTAIRQTTEHVRDVAAAWGLPLHELRPKVRYLDLVLGKVLSTRGENKGRPVWRGFPGPGGDSHNVFYQRLKGEPLERFRAQQVGRDGVRRKVLYITGTRWDETDRRFRNAGEVTVDGGAVWVSPLIHWTNAHMQEYRARYRCSADHEHAPHHMCTPDALPLNEVTAHLHMSGDCTCGCYAKPDELDEIGMFYPEKADEIREMQRVVEAAGEPWCKWGVRPKGTERAPKGERKVTPWLCAGCPAPLEGQTDILDDWRDRGLLTDAQYATFTRTTDAA